MNITLTLRFAIIVKPVFCAIKKEEKGGEIGVVFKCKREVPLFTGSI